jgi:hypothetical protein
MTSISPERRSQSDRTVESTRGACACACAWFTSFPHSSGTAGTTCSPWSSAVSKPPIVSEGGTVTGMPGTLARAERTCPRPSTPVISIQPTVSLTEREIAHVSFAVSFKVDVHPTVWSEHVRPPSKAPRSVRSFRVPSSATTRKRPFGVAAAERDCLPTTLPGSGLH